MNHFSLLFYTRSDKYIKKQYEKLLNKSLKNSFLCDVKFTCNYKKNKEANKKNYLAYCNYAKKNWKLLEKIYKLNKTNTFLKYFSDVNKLHYKWLLDNKHLFSLSFVDYVINYLNQLTIVKANKNDFNIIYDYMLDEFTKDELKEKQQFIRLLKTNKYHLFLLKYQNIADVDNSILGYALCYINQTNTLMFLDYINILKSYQNRNYGSMFLNLLKDSLNHNGLGLILEIEIPTSDDLIKQKRKNFYLRNGANELEFDYKMPLKDHKSLSLELLCLPCKNVEYISKNTIQVFIKEAILTIHSDYDYTIDIINSYIDSIPDFYKNSN